MQAFKPRFGDGVDVLIGSGRAQLQKALKESGHDLSAMARQHERSIYTSVSDVPEEALRPVVLLDDNEFDLEKAIELARRILSKSRRGYFLMVESDAHTDSIKRGLDRVVTFDRVIASTAGRVDGNTLLLFTADHSFDLRVHNGLSSSPPKAPVASACAATWRTLISFT